MQTSFDLRTLNTSSPKQQQGVVLVVSLLLLLVMTIVSVTSMNNSIMQEKMAANSQNSNRTFQAAESAVNAQIATVLGGDQSKLNEAMKEASKLSTETTLNLGSKEPAAKSQVEFLGNIITTGGNSINADASSTLLNGYRFEISGTGTISAVGAQTVIRQGIDYH